VNGVIAKKDENVSVGLVQASHDALPLEGVSRGPDVFASAQPSCTVGTRACHVTST